MVRAGSKSETGIFSDEPAVKMTAAVSRDAAPDAEDDAGDDARQRRRQHHLHDRLPLATRRACRLTSRYAAGTARIASSAVRMIVGRIMNASVRPPASTDQPMLQVDDEEDEAEQAEDDRGHARQAVGAEAHDAREPALARVLGEVDRGAEAERRGDGDADGR